MNILSEERLKEVCRMHNVEYVGLQRYDIGTAPLFIFFNILDKTSRLCGSTRAVYYSPCIKTVEKRLEDKLNVIRGES